MSTSAPTSWRRLKRLRRISRNTACLLLALAAAVAVGALSDAHAREPAPALRFMRAPIVTFAGSGAATNYGVYVRLPAVLPDGKRVTSLAQVSLGVSRPGSTHFYNSMGGTVHTGRGRGTCLGNPEAAGAGGGGEKLPEALRHPAAGKSVIAVMRVSFPDGTRRYVRRRVRLAADSPSEQVVARRLGCRP